MLHTQPLRQEDIRRALGAHPWAELVTVLDTVDSTNTYAKALAAQGAPYGTAVLADRQTGGRGRLGRSFSSPKGLGVYCSVILRYDAPPQQLLHLTAVAAEASRRAIADETGLQTAIKWTNDLVYARRKLCGILTELAVTPQGRTDYIIIGVGINCGQTAPDFPPEVAPMATSLLQLGKPADRGRLAAALLRRLSEAAEDMLSAPQSWMDGYRTHCITVGQDVKIVRGDEVRYAHADGIDDCGALLVTLADGSSAVINSGEVSVRGMYGYL